MDYISGLSDLPYEQFDVVLNALQTFVEKVGHEYSASFWMGEFGTGTNSENWRKIVRFIREHDLDWSYWCVDGYQFGRDEDSTWGVLNNDFATVRDSWRMEQLKEMMPILS